MRIAVKVWKYEKVWKTVCVCEVASNVFSLVLLMPVQSDHSVYEYGSDNGRATIIGSTTQRELMWPASFVPANIQPLYWGYISPKYTRISFYRRDFWPKKWLFSIATWWWEGACPGSVGRVRRRWCGIWSQILVIPLFTPSMHQQLLWRWCQTVETMRCVTCAYRG